MKIWRNHHVVGVLEMVILWLVMIDDSLVLRRTLLMHGFALWF